MGSTLVDPDGSAVRQLPDRDRSTRPIQWLVAAIVGLLAAATLAIGESGGVDLTRLSEGRVIEEYLDAWYGGDYDGAAALTTAQRLRTGPSEQRARAEVEYQEMLDAEVVVRRCETLPPSTVRCEVTYSNALNQAIAAPPSTVDLQFGVEAGLIAFVAGPYLDDEGLTASFESFAGLLFPTDYRNACDDEPNYQTPDCARFKLDHLEDWASWHRIEYG